MTKPLPTYTKRLAGLVNRPGGITAEEAVSAAEERLEGLCDRGLADIAATLQAMQERASALHQRFEPELCQELYRMSNSLIGVAGVFGRGGVGEVARSLCALLEGLHLVQTWERDAVQLHLDSLRLLAGGGASASEVATISAALRQVVGRVRQSPAGRFN